MSIVVPHARTHLAADALFGLVRSGFANIPDDRLSDPDIAFTDALMAAFAMFSLTSPSLLAFDKERAEGNVATIDGLEHVPCDTHMRERLDAVSPESLRPVLKSVFRQVQRGKALEALAFLDGHSLLALDGTGYFASRTIHCPACRQKVHRNGSITSYHQMLGAAIVHPDVREVMPRMPEPIMQHDGADKNDGERHAAKRFLPKLRRDHPHLQCIVTEDSLRANAPHLATLDAHGLHDILGVKEGDHASLFQHVQAAEHAGHVTSYARHDRAAGVLHRFRFLNDMPLNASNTDVRVNCIAYWEMGDGKVQHFRWVTDLRVNTRNVYHLMRGGRARWKIDHETCHTLTNQGDNFEHNDGHGTQHLSVVFATIMTLAFLVDQVQQRCCALFWAVWRTLGSKRLLWERRRALFYPYRLDSRRALFVALLYGWEKPHPILTTDTS